MFSITQNGIPLSPDKYTWDEVNKVLTTSENNLVLDFSEYDGVTFKTGSECTFDTGNDCTFNTDSGCAFDTGICCTFKTGNGCTFNTDGGCTFNTDSGCAFDTSICCTFKTGNGCTFNTDGGCTFDTGYDCTFAVDGILCKYPHTKDDFMELLKSGWKHFEVTKDDLLDVLI